MIDGLKPYAEYKDSGVSWLGRVPGHWLVSPNRAIFAEVKDRDHPNEEMLSVTIARGIVQQKTLLADTSKKDSANQNKTAYKLVQPHDIAYNKMRAWQGAIAVSDFRGIISPAYVVMRLRSPQVPRYFHHLYRTPQFAKEAERWSYGITSDMWSLRPEHFKMIYTPLPPPDEQAAIVKFLDYANGKIERAIRAKRKLVGLLNEQKQAIIHRAVTRGLDPNVKLKPSGIPWLGDVPEHWEVRALKRVVAAKITDGPHETPQLLDDGIDFISAESMVNGQFVFERRRGFISRELHEQYCIKCRPKRDDVFMCKSGATTGKVAIVETDKEFSVWSPLALLRANNRVVLPRFLFVVLQTQYVQQQVKEKWSFGTQQNLSMGGMGRILIAVPTIPEQLDAIERIGQRSAPLNTTIARLEREIDLLREYRTTLTAEVVTGKLDVREAAKRLPDQADEPLPPDESLDDLVDEEIAEEVET
jgi:type I restriction enzyme S subunit